MLNSALYRVVANLTLSSCSVIGPKVMGFPPLVITANDQIERCRTSEQMQQTLWILKKDKNLPDSSKE